MADSDSGTPAPNDSGFRLRTRLGLYLIAWVGALLATNPNGGLIALIWMFPVGLAAFIDRRWGSDGGWAVFWACCAIYVVHGILYFRSRTKRSTLILLAVLVILLICNVSGCRSMINTH